MLRTLPSSHCHAADVVDGDRRTLAIDLLSRPHRAGSSLPDLAVRPGSLSIAPSSHRKGRAMTSAARHQRSSAVIRLAELASVPTSAAQTSMSWHS